MIKYASKNNWINRIRRRYKNKINNSFWHTKWSTFKTRRINLYVLWNDKNSKIWFRFYWYRIKYKINCRYSWWLVWNRFCFIKCFRYTWRNSSLFSNICKINILKLDNLFVLWYNYNYKNKQIVILWRFLWRTNIIVIINRINLI